MAQKKTKRRKKKVKFKGLSFKISANQYKLLQRYCTKHKTTPNKVIKKSLTVYMERFGPVLDHIPTVVSDNQLTIFDAGAGEPAERANHL